MISIDKDALMCDLAETYGIYDIRSLPATTVATFSVGLRDNSRIMTKIRGEDHIETNTLLLGMIHDNISRVLVALGAIEEPKLISPILLGKEEEDNAKQKVFDNAESYEETRKRIIKEINNGRN